MNHLISGFTVGQTAEQLGLSDLLIVSVLKTVRLKLAAKTDIQAAVQFAAQHNDSS